MSEMGGSYDPGPWTGYDFKSARAAYSGYDPDAGRGYGKSKSAGSAGGSVKKTLEHLIPDRVETQARSPVVIVTDGTGSMGEFPKVIFEKLPLLDLGIADYLDDAEISVAMVGDAGYDARPLQVQQYTKGKGLVESLNKLVIESGGGGNQQESYDLAALYYARNAEMPKAVKPVMFFICDEGIYPHVDPKWGKDYANVDLEKKMKTDDLFNELKEKYSVYCIRKHFGPHSGDKMEGADLAIHNQWERYVGADRIAMLDDPRRVVDVMFGLLAYETNKMDFFKKELTYRQTPAQVAAVMKTMMTIGKPQAQLPAAKSVLKR